MKEPEIPGIIIAMAAIASPTNITIALYNENPGVIWVSGFSDLNITINIIIPSEIMQQMIDDNGIFFDCSGSVNCSNPVDWVTCIDGIASIELIEFIVSSSKVWFLAFIQCVKSIGMLPSIIPMKNQFVCIGKLLNKYVIILLKSSTPVTSPAPNGRMNFHWDMIFLMLNEIKSIILL